MVNHVLSSFEYVELMRAGKLTDIIDKAYQKGFEAGYEQAQEDNKDLE